MDFLGSYFFKDEPLISCSFLSSKLDSHVIKTLERHSFNVKNCLSYVLINGESNFDESNVKEMFNCFIRERNTSYKIGTLELTKFRINVHFFVKWRTEKLIKN